MSKTKEKEKPLVNHRWQMPSLEDMVDQMLPEWADGKHPDFSGQDGHAKLKRAFMQFGNNLLSRISMSMEKAASKGIEQALHLIRDPEYTTTVRRRTRRQIQRQEEYERQLQAARERRRRCEFTFDEKARELAQLNSSIQYHEKALREAEERRAKVEAATPSNFDTDLVKENVRPTLAADGDSGPSNDEWPDQITFD